MSSTVSLLAIARQLAQSERFQDAEAILQRILQLEPSCAEAWFLLGSIACQTGNHHVAISSLTRSIELDPALSTAYANLGLAYEALGDREAALAAFTQALALNPLAVEIQFERAMMLIELERLPEAVESLTSVLTVDAEYPGAYFQLGQVHSRIGNIQQAIEAFTEILKRSPRHFETYLALGNLYASRGFYVEAVENLRMAVAIKPTDVAPYLNLALVLHKQGRDAEAESVARMAIAVAPHDVAARNNLGAILFFRDQLDESREFLQQSIVDGYESSVTHNLLGNVFQQLGQTDEAVACYRRAIEIDPDFVGAHSNLIYGLHLLAGTTSDELVAECRRWNARFAPLSERRGDEPRNSCEPERLLRIGYVSPHLHAHPVGLCMSPILEHHDRQQYEIFVYSSSQRSDEVSNRLRKVADQWRDVSHLCDEALARLIRDDQIDILVDLAAHSESHRLMVFARKPAPVQATFLAYCSTAGLPAIDYRFSDQYLDPSQRLLPNYAEETVRLAETYWCYRPLDATLTVRDLPASRNGYVTFGCLNCFAKVSAPTYLAFAQILSQFPNSRLVLHASGPAQRQRAASIFNQLGIATDRISFTPRQTWPEYMRSYSQIDIALDPFPYNGGITTCDALWMGVPVVTLAGELPVNRAGVSILTHVGLHESCVAESVNGYIDVAMKMATDVPRLSELRHSLRSRLESSPIMNHGRYVQNLENAYRSMWNRWCSDNSRRQ